MVFLGVADPEEVPLCVAISIDVVLKNQIVFLVTYLDGSQQVA